MNDPIPEEEKSRRLAILQEKQREIQTARNTALIGQTFEVLVGGKSRRGKQWAGHTTPQRALSFSSQAKAVPRTHAPLRRNGPAPPSLAGQPAHQRRARPRGR